MAKGQVYGKRSHAYKQASIFISPEKVKGHVDVLEITDELSRLTVHPPRTSHKDAETETSETITALKPIQANERAVRSLREPREKKSKHSQQQTEDVSQENKHETAVPTKHQIDVQKDEDAKNVPLYEQGVEKAPKPARRAALQSLGNVAPPIREQISDQVTIQTTESTTEPTPAHAIPSCSVSSSDQTASPVQPSEPTAFELHTTDLLSLSLRPITSFSIWSSSIATHFSVSKIAEASFGEVYRLSLLRPHPKLSRADESVLKVIALKPPTTPSRPKKMSKKEQERVDMMSDPKDVAGEVRLLQRMTSIPGFTNFRDVSVLQGRPGGVFVEAWKRWNASQKQRGKGCSEFPDPAKKASYGEEQLWAVIEMQDAGCDLENVRIENIWGVWDVFWGVVLSLGKGEEGARFEHRDLHLGNICVSRRDGVVDVGAIEEDKIDERRKLRFTGIETTIIDYTISRAEMEPSRSLEHVTAQEEPEIAYLDLEKDPAVFTGDSELEYQYDIYRYMRSAMFLDDPMADVDSRWSECEASKRTWKGYHPQTNLVWLHFVLYKLLEQMEWPSSVKAGKMNARKMELETALQRVQELLDPEIMPGSGLRSAADLVALALREGWLRIEDVLGSGPDADDVVSGPRERRRGRKKGANRVAVK